jgi:hypothetical protein
MNKEFLLSELFEVKTTKSIDKNKIIFSSDGKYDFIGRSSVNNGIQGKVNRLEYEPNPRNTFSLVQVGESVCLFREHEWYASQNIFILIPKIDEICLVPIYIITTINIYLSVLFGSAYTYPKLTDVKAIPIHLPVIKHSDPNHKYTIDDIDWQYMEERIKELEAYLKVANLDNYELTDEDKKVLSLSRKLIFNENVTLETDCKNGILRFKKFNIGASYTMRGKTIDVDKDGLFNIIPTKKKINAIDIEFNGNHPYVARGEGKNGIRGYIDYDEKYLNEANTISFGQDTATVNYQSQKYFTGDKIQVFKLNKKYGNLTEDKAIYLINSIKKVFERFLWGQQSYALDIISKIKITLPVTLDGKPDFDYMERYIRAIEKLVIKDIVLWADKE